MNISLDNCVELIGIGLSQEPIIAWDKPLFKGIEAYKEENKKEIQTTIADVVELIQQESADIDLSMSIISDAVLKYASDLYAAGADVGYCKNWIAIYVTLLLINKNYVEAAIYATLANEAFIINHLPDVAINTKNVDEILFWQQLQRKTIHPLDLSGEGSIMNSAYKNIYAYPNATDKQLDEAFQVIAHYRYEDGWSSKYHYGEFPLFEPVLCAIMCNAISLGYKPLKLDTKSKLFFAIALSNKKANNFFELKNKTEIVISSNFLNYWRDIHKLKP
jgi:hypothetical protein